MIIPFIYQKLMFIFNMAQYTSYVDVAISYFLRPINYMARYGKTAPARTTVQSGGQKKVEKTMHEFKRGQLKSGRSGKTVRHRKQAKTQGKIITNLYYSYPSRSFLYHSNQFLTGEEYTTSAHPTHLRLLLVPDRRSWHKISPRHHVLIH